MPLPHHTATVLLRCRHPFRPTAAAQRRLLCQHVDSDSKYGKAEWEAYAERASGAPEPRALLQVAIIVCLMNVNSAAFYAAGITSTLSFTHMSCSLDTITYRRWPDSRARMPHGPT